MNEATAAHSRRVAALAREIAARLGIPSQAVFEAALSHHNELPSIPEVGLDRLITDLQNLNGAISAAGIESPETDLVTSIVEVAHAFEQGLEFAPYEPRSAPEILDEIDMLGFDAKIVAALRSISAASPRPPSDLSAYPAVLLKALALLRDENASYDDVERVIKTDQVLASSVLGVANTALHGPVSPIKTIGRAIAHIGMNAAKKIIVAAAARPLFASAALHGLWQHSLEVATIAERLARATRKASPTEAFVAGLIHDIGRLAIESLPRDIVETYHRISDDAQCTVLADMAVIGCDHGEFGARTIGLWQLPPELVNAVSYHHRPELAGAIMPKLLFLAEFVSESDEDIPSTVRLRAAMDAVGIGSIGELVSRSEFDKRVASVLALVG